MKRCTAATSRKLCAAGAQQAGRRWTSHSSASLTDEALLEKVSARLNDGKYGDKITVDAKKKTISTPTGELPMSPLFDPAWIRSRRREAKKEPRPSSGQFRKRLENSPFGTYSCSSSSGPPVTNRAIANALATPLRYCPITMTRQPRYFLQEYDIVRHPETNEGWFAPTNAAFKHSQRNTEIKRAAAAGSPAPPDSRAGADEHTPRVKCYTASQQSILDAVEQKKGLRGTLLAMRRGMAMRAETNAPVWRSNMGGLVLQTIRKEIVDALVLRAGVKDNFYVEPCDKWEDIRDVDRRGCILWFPADNETGARQYATYDIPGAKYGSKMVVHNLPWMLGEEEVVRLRSESPMFKDNNLLVLKTWRSKTVKELHMLLWRLHGYLDVDSA